VQHHHHVLRIARIRLAGDEGGGEQLLLAQRMGMHPVGAGHEEKVHLVRPAGREFAAVGAGAVLVRRGEDLAVPVHHRRRLRGIEHRAGEAVTRLGEDAFAGRALDGENLGRLAVHVDCEALHGDERGSESAVPPAGESERAGGGATCEDGATGHGGQVLRSGHGRPPGCVAGQTRQGRD